MCKSVANLYGDTVVVTLSNNQIELAATSAAFEYNQDIQINSGLTLKGPRFGGTDMTARGNTLSKAISCIFGSQKVIIKSKTSGQIICTSPANYKEESVVFGVSDNDQDYTFSSLLFEYHKDFTVSSVFPRRIPRSVSTLISIYGSNFFSGMKIKIESYLQDAVFIDETQITCVSPSSITGNSMSISISGDNQNYITFGEMTTILVFENPILNSLTPTKITEKTIIIFSGTGFVDSIDFKCKLGNQITNTRFLNTGSFMCAAPYYQGNDIPVEISFNNQDYTGISTIDYTQEVSVIQSRPYIGRTYGNTLIHLNVANAVKSSLLSCFFEIFYNQYTGLMNRLIVPATYINNTHISCVSPQIPYPGVSIIRVSNDGQQFSRSYTSYEYIETCKDAVSCDNNVILPCSKGKFCDEDI